jgi:hypothetical protein
MNKITTVNKKKKWLDNFQNIVYHKKDDFARTSQYSEKQKRFILTSYINKITTQSRENMTICIKTKPKTEHFNEMKKKLTSWMSLCNWIK